MGYKNGVIECFDANTLESLEKKYTGIKNPDEEVLNLVRINKDGFMCLGCYQFPKFKIILFDLTKKNIVALSSIEVSSRIIAVDFDIDSKYIRFNSSKFEYLVYNIDKFT